MSEGLAVEFDSISKSFGNTLAVDGVSFSVSSGEFFGLLGPNGAGKTTLMKILTGLANPTEGTARVFGHDVSEDYRQAHSYVGFAPAEANLDREFSILDNLRFHAGYNGIASGEQRTRAEDQLKKFDLWEKRNDKPYELSTGMRKKLLFARATITDPGLVILDEPTAGLDLETKRTVHDYIKKITAEGITILFTTHRIDEAEELCDRVAIMKEGRIVAIGEPGSLLAERARDRVIVTLTDNAGFDPDRIELDGYEIDYEPGMGELVAAAGDGEKAAVDILGHLREKGISAQSVRVENSGLEELFLKLTSKET